VLEEIYMRTIQKYKYSQHISCSALVGQLMSSDCFWFRDTIWWRRTERHWLAQTKTSRYKLRVKYSHKKRTNTRYMCASKTHKYALYVRIKKAQIIENKSLNA